MGKLSSCYFCASALDASLSEYPVVPKQFRVDDRDSTTVVLCDPCRRKLATIIEEVAEAAAIDTEIDVDIETPTTQTDSVTELTDEASETAPDPPSDTPTSDTATQTDPGTSPAEDTPEATADQTDPAESSEATETADDDGPSLSRLEYNKVMRLLQNRQFPVDRGEIRDVAVSAYDVDPSEFDAIVDTAIDRGLIAERNEQFVDPE